MSQENRSRRVVTAAAGAALVALALALPLQAAPAGRNVKVINTPEETLSRGMQWLNGKYAQWFNRKYKRSGHLFQGRFKGFVVEKETYLLRSPQSPG